MYTKLFRVFVPGFLLALVLGGVFFISSSQQAHAATAIAAHPNDIPDDPCLSITNSFIGNKITINWSSPPGNALNYRLYLRVDNNCSTEVSSIVGVAKFTGICPDNAKGNLSDQVKWDFTLQPGGNGTVAFPITDFCEVPGPNGSFISTPPLSVSIDLDAAGVFDNGGVAYAPGAVLNV